MRARFLERIRVKAWLPAHLPMSETSPKNKGMYPKVWARSLVPHPQPAIGSFLKRRSALRAALGRCFGFPGRGDGAHPGCGNRAGVLTDRTTRRLA